MQNLELNLNHAARYYTVVKGDTLWAIAKKYYAMEIDIQRLQELIT
jgi:LysM repeat protein